jgi:hypothetical protein
MASLWRNKVCLDNAKTSGFGKSSRAATKARSSARNCAPKKRWQARKYPHCTIKAILLDGCRDVSKSERSAAGRVKNFFRVKLSNNGGVSYSLISSGCKMRMTDIAASHYKTSLLSTVGKPQYNKNGSANDFKNATPTLVR